ncbi:hypothetical protein ACFL6L_05065 [candidate division KSB1 bacterium]
MCRRIRENNPISTITAITGYANMFSNESCKEAGFNSYFKKPFRLDKLLTYAEDVFENKQV